MRTPPPRRAPPFTASRSSSIEVITGTFLTKALTLEANAAVENAVNSNMPFFLHMSFYALHTPFTTNPDATGNYSAAVNSNHTKYATMVEGMDIAVGEIRQKLIYNFQNNTHELYNLATDPTESTNLAASQPESTMALTRRLAQMLDAGWGPAGILIPTISTTAPSGNVVSIPDIAGIDLDNVGIDLDNDGIDDRDEDSNLNGLVDPGETDPDNDNTDNDNVSDGQELQLGLDPLNSNSFFFLHGSRQADGTILLNWPSQPGVSFEIRSSTDLVDWDTVVDPNVPAANPGSSTTYIVPASAQPKEFYRISLK